MLTKEGLNHFVVIHKVNLDHIDKGMITQETWEEKDIFYRCTVSIEDK